MSSFALHCIIVEDHGDYTVQSVDSHQSKVYEEFFQAISTKDLIQCLRLLKTINVTYKFLNQPIFICDPECCNTNCIAINLCHFAVFNDCEDILEELLKYGGDLSTKTVEVTILSNQQKFVEKDSLFDLIIRRFKEPLKYFQNVFDGYIETTDIGSLYEFKFDFSVLYPASAMAENTPLRCERQMSVLNEIVNSSYEVYSQECGFLQHPLIEAYLACKWRHYRRFFYLLVALHVLFVSFLSATALVIIRNFESFEDLQTKHSSDQSRIVLTTLEVLNYLQLIMGIILLCHAVIQACFIPLRKLVYQFEIISNLLTSSFALLNCIYGIAQPLPWQLRHHLELTYSLNSLIILPAWINLMLIIGRIPSLGCYSLMFTTVMKNFLKVMVSFIFLMIGFSLSFSLALPMSKWLQNPFEALLRTLVMMVGELNYVESYSNNSTFSNGISKSIFALFVISCSIILMNLTQGIAVNDIKLLHEISQIIRLEKETRFLCEFESIFTQKIMKSNSFLKKIKERLYDIGIIQSEMKVTRENRKCVSIELLAKLTQQYKPTKSTWSRKLKHPRFSFKCQRNYFNVSKPTTYLTP